MRFRYQNATNLKERARTMLMGNYTVCVESVLVFEAIRFVLLSGLSLLVQILLTRFAGLQSGTGYVIFAAVYWVVLVLLGAFINMMLSGLALICLKISGGLPISISDLLQGYQTGPERTFKISLGISIPQSLAILPFQLLLEYWMDVPSKELIPWLVVSGIVGFALAVFFSLSLGMGFFLMHDFPNLSAGETLRETWRRMKGHKTRLLILELSFVPLMILCLLSFGVGYLWVYPLMEESIALFYLDMMNPQPVSDHWERTV